MEKSGAGDLSELRGESEEEESSLDPEMCSMVLLVLGELESDGKIYCRCEHTDVLDEEKFEFEIKNDGILIKCQIGRAHV